MKSFIHPDGIFEISIPNTWTFFTTKQENVFIFVENRANESYKFRIVINKFRNVKHRNSYINRIRHLPKVELGEFQCYCQSETLKDTIIYKVFTAINEDKYINFILYFNAKSDGDENQKFLDDKTEIVYSVIKDFKFIQEEDKQAKIALFRLNEFLHKINIAKTQFRISFDKHSYLETLCYASNLLDAFLRFSIFLKTQSLKNTSEILLEFIHYVPMGEKFTEKDIKNKALELGIIDEEEVMLMNKLNNYKNKVIYQFIISNVNLTKILSYIAGYNYHLSRLSNIIKKLKDEQIQKNIGLAQAEIFFNIKWDIDKYIKRNTEVPEKFITKRELNRIQARKINFQKLIDRWG
jgi:hypothetical protein